MLRRLAGRGAPPEPPAIAARWDELRRTAPELAPGIDLQRSVQRLQRAAALDASPPAFAAAEAHDRLAAGVPLLQGAPSFLAVGAVFGLFRALAREAVRGEAILEARAVLARLDRGAFDLAHAIAAACALDAVALTAALEALGEQRTLGATLFSYATAPGFQIAAGRYAPFLEAGAWARNVCPVCAAPPLLGELRGGESRRVLRCGRCGAAWPYQRLRCARCETFDHQRLASLHAEGEGDFLRIEVCDACGGYIKSLARLDPLPLELLAAEDLATAHLDLAALERGYGRPRPQP